MTSRFALPHQLVGLLVILLLLLQPLHGNVQCVGNYIRRFSVSEKCHASEATREISNRTAVRHSPYELLGLHFASCCVLYRIPCVLQSKVIANYDFRPENRDEELEMKRGDIVSVLNKNDPNWWLGEITRGNDVIRGLFPKNYVSPYTD